MVNINNTELSKYKLELKPRNQGLTENTESNISKIQRIILSNRIPEDNPSDETLNSYFYNLLTVDKNLEKLADVYKAAEIISRNIKEEKHILIVTDYDADGTTSAVVLYKVFSKVFKVPEDRLSVIVNKRKTGNGFSNNLMKRILDLHATHKVDMIITADHGSNDNPKFVILKEHGIELVVTDHHQVKMEEYPHAADCFINNQREDSTYYKEVSGCFIAFITMVATYKHMFPNRSLNVFNFVLPYVAISTITDIMSLRLAINRYIVKTGLQELNSFRNRGWLGIRKILDIPGKISYKEVGFKLGPLINTANRIDCEDLAFKMLMAESYSDSYTYAEELFRLNTMRKTITKKVVSDLNKELKGTEGKHSLVLEIQTNISINGNIASNIGNNKHLPTICFINNDTDKKALVGSCRGIVKGVDVFKLFTSIHQEDDSIFIKFGGHKGAGGCSINADKMERFKELFEKYSTEQLKSIPISDTIEYDAFIPDFLLNPSLARMVESCGPYGENWEDPIFVSKLKVSRIIIMGTMAKITFTKRTGGEIDAMHFFSKKSDITVENIKDRIKRDSMVYVAYNIYIDSYLKSFNLGMTIVDIKPIGDHHD